MGALADAARSVGSGGNCEDAVRQAAQLDDPLVVVTEEALTGRHTTCGTKVKKLI